MIEIDVTAFMQVVEMAFRYALLTVAFLGGAVIGFGLVSMIMGDDEGEDE